MKTAYRHWPDDELARELFAMRRAIVAHPDDASRWIRRLEAVEREARRRRPKRRRVPIGERIASRIIGDRDAEGTWVDYTPGEPLVVVDDNAVLWGVGPDGSCRLLSVFRRGHLACIVRSLRLGVFAVTEWEYPESDISETGDNHAE